jgi:trimeric autotransporter adhesin
LSEIAVNFQAHGVANVMQAFASIEKQAAKFGAAVLRGERSTTQAVIRETAKQHDAHVKAYEKASQAGAKATIRGAQEAKKLADRKIREVERSAKESVRIEERAAKEKERILRAEVRTFERETAKMNRIAEKSAKERANAEANAQRSAAQSRRNIARTITGSVGSAMGTVGAMAGGVLAVGGGFSAVDSVQTGMRNRGRAADIAIASGGDLNKKDILSRASSAATLYGTSTENALAATDRFFAKSGNAKQAMEMMPQILALATATGGDAGEIGEAAGQVANADRSLTAKQVADVTRGWAGQGRAGSIDMRELASGGARLAASAGLFGGDKAANMVALGGVAQIATAGGAASAAEATEAVSQLGSDTWRHKDAFKAAGIKAFDGKKLVDPETLIKRSVIATGGDRGKLQELFGERSIKAVAGAANTYQDAFIASKKGGASEKDAKAAAARAMDAQFDVFKKAALTEEQVRKDAAERLSEADKKLEGAMNELKDKVADELMPVMTKLVGELKTAIPDIVKLAKVLAEIAGWAAKNPLAGIGALIAGLVTKDIVAAGLGKVVADAIARAMAGGAVPAGAPGAAAGGSAAAGGAGGGILASGAAGAAAGAAVAVGTGYRTIKSASAGSEAGLNLVDQMMSEITNTSRRLKSGNMSPETAAYVAKQMHATLESAKENSTGARTVEAAASAPLALVSSDARGTIARYNQNAVVASAADDLGPMLKKLAADAKAASEDMAKASDSMKGVNLTDPKTGKPLSSPDRH